MSILTELVIFVIFSSLFLQGMAYGYPGAYPGATIDAPAPLKQLKIGLDVGEIECNKNMVLLIKDRNSSPACVKESTVTRLLENGWRYPTENDVDDSVELNSIDDLVNFLGKHYSVELGEVKSHLGESPVQVILLDSSEIVVTEYQNKKESINAAYQTYSKILNMRGDVDPICCTSYFLTDNLVTRIYYYYDVPDFVESFEVIMGSPFSELGGFQFPSREYVDSVDDLVNFLREHRAIKLKTDTTFIEPELGIGEVVSINGKYLHVFSFCCIEDAENAAMQIKEKIAQGYEEMRKLGEEQNMIVDPACDFRYYILDFLIIVYVGYSEVVDMLDSSLGEPFVQTFGMNAGCDAINEGFLKNAG